MVFCETKPLLPPTGKSLSTRLDRSFSILASKSRRAENGEELIKEHLLLTRHNPGRVSRGDMRAWKMLDPAHQTRRRDPEDQSVLRASNQGEPVILDINADAGKAYADTVERLLGEERPFRFIEEEKKGFPNACSEDKLWHYSISFLAEENTGNIAKRTVADYCC